MTIRRTHDICRDIDYSGFTVVTEYANRAILSSNLYISNSFVELQSFVKDNASGVLV